MGGLFSSNKNTEVVQPTSYNGSSYSYHDNLRNRNRVVTQRNLDYSAIVSWTEAIANRNTRVHSLEIPNRPHRGERNPSNVFVAGNAENIHSYSSSSSKYNLNYFPLSKHISVSASTIYHLLPVQDSEYREIRRRITNKNFIINSVEKIHNSYLEYSYSYKKNQKLKDYPYLVELELFHGTKRQNADSICKNNFNWRYNGQGTGHKYGKGVSFSCNAMYASNYADKDNYEKVMFISKVLIGETCLGTSYMELPEEGCDTSTKQCDNIVVVKYEDNEFYPIYKIKFIISHSYNRKNDGNRGRFKTHHGNN